MALEVRDAQIDPGSGIRSPRRIPRSWSAGGS